MIRRSERTGRLYCDGHECGYPLAFFEGDADEQEPGMWVCLDCNSAMYAEREEAA